MADDCLQGKVGFLVSSESWVNHQKWHCTISRALYERGYDVAVITPKKGRLFVKSKRYGIQVQHFKKRFFFLFNFIKLYRIFRNEGISTLFLTHPKDLKITPLAAKSAGVKQVIYRRGTASEVRKHPVNEWIFTHLISGVITNSDANKYWMLEKKPNIFQRNKISVIYNGLNINEFDPRKLMRHDYRKNGELLVGLLNGHFQGDRFLHLLRMIQSDRKKEFRVRFLIYGQEDKRNGLSKRLQEMGIKRDLVYWDHWSKDLLEFMNSIDVFISGSVRNSFNYPVMYAMALQKPVIGYDQGSNQEMIRDHSNGYLLKKGDLQGIQKRLEALTDDDLRRKLGYEARQTIVQEFDFERSIDQIEGLVK